MKLTYPRAIWLHREMEGVPGVGSMSFRLWVRRYLRLSGRQITLWRRGARYTVLDVILPGATPRGISVPPSQDGASAPEDSTDAPRHTPVG